jgi:hypothetical protein
MRQNVVMICIFYNYVSSNLTNVPLLFSYQITERTKDTFYPNISNGK